MKAKVLFNFNASTEMWPGVGYGMIRKQGSIIEVEEYNDSRHGLYYSDGDYYWAPEWLEIIPDKLSSYKERRRRNVCP